MNRLRRTAEISGNTLSQLGHVAITRSSRDNVSFRPICMHVAIDSYGCIEVFSSTAAIIYYVDLKIIQN